MKEIEILEGPSERFEVAIGPNESTCALTMACVDRDIVIRKSPMQTSQRVTRATGSQRVQNKWHEVNVLNARGELLEAVCASSFICRYRGPND